MGLRKRNENRHLFRRPVRPAVQKAARAAAASREAAWALENAELIRERTAERLDRFSKGVTIRAANAAIIIVPGKNNRHFRRLAGNIAKSIKVVSSAKEGLGVAKYNLSDARKGLENAVWRRKTGPRGAVRVIAAGPEAMVRVRNIRAIKKAKSGKKT